EYSVKTPAVVTLPILLPLCSANQRFPSGPAAMPIGQLPAVGILYSVKTPAVVTFPILFPLHSVNQRLPSAPEVMNTRPLLAVGTVYSVMVTACAAAGSMVATSSTSGNVVRND